MISLCVECKGRVIAEAVSHRLPTAAAGFEPGSDHVGFVVDKVALGQVFSDYLVSRANSHSTDCSTLIIYHPRLVQ
jgi:Zn-dependent M28 family amino/carboxypeptidase